ncbi:MAG TPA: FAD-dependent oxidoreductase [Acidimicrobiales bacterium]|nr:FAD-dependent oxidoreductase [Acidimicrobiales bacterium]
MANVIVIGGGVAGLGSALALNRAGHHVTVLERDPLPATADAEEAFEAPRRGAPQVHQTHGFLARIMVILRDRYPDVLGKLMDAGAFAMPGVANFDDEPQPGDEDLKVLIVRRTTFEWVLRMAVVDEPNVEVRTGVAVSGLIAGPVGVDGVPTVVGVTLEDGTEVRGDLVVCAGGRRSDVPGLLKPLGVEVPEKIVESGLMYVSRWYSWPGGLDLKEAKLGGDLGFVKFLGIPGDAGTMSVTLAVRTDDHELRHALSNEDNFDRACELLPGPNLFFENGRPEPRTEVKVMGGLLNRLRTFTDDVGEPTVLGFHAVGDAHTCTNPLYGRGCSLAMVQATLLADSLTEHEGDARAVAAAYEAACRREVEPWYELSVQMDIAGADPKGWALGGKSDPNEMNPMRALFLAAQTDPVIGRAFARFFNLLALPQEFMADPEIMRRVGDVMMHPENYPAPPAIEGPSRRELLAELQRNEESVNA